MTWSPFDYAFACLHISFGLVIIYAALFLYEDEERRIQDKLDEWWINLRDMESASRSRALAFTQEVAKLTGRGFDRLLGKSLISLRFAVSSICFSLASLFLFGYVILIFRLSSHPPASASARDAFIWFLVFSALGSLPAFTGSKVALQLWWFAILVVMLPTMGSLLGFLVFAFRTRGLGVTARGVGYVLLPFLFSLFCDLIFIAITRLILRQVSKSDRMYHIVLGVLVNLLILELLIWLPIFLGAEVAKLWPLAGGTVMFSFPLNSIDFIACFASLVLGLLLLLHRLLWPMIQRPLYAVCRFAPLKNKLLMWGIGLTLLFLPSHNTIEFLKSHLKS